MITNKDLTTLNLSPTNKDFVQIWNELLDVAGKLSARWDPTATNESDPGIVLLKVLAGIADKLNYNIDKNILEAYMPTAAQRESMYKLCDMMGYNIKYYRSAETYATIWYTGSWQEGGATRIGIPPFSILSDANDTVHYVTTNAITQYITPQQNSLSIHCVEGSLVECTSINIDNTITMAQLTADNRFYLPELQIAENGIFVRNYITDSDAVRATEFWENVTNLNTCPKGKTVFKFCFDSFLGRPYLQFPEDISSLINDGLKISYLRTSGINGNIAIRTLSKITEPTSFGDGIDPEAFVVMNDNIASSGADIETITEAYNNFKKTVGTFETLVTCRDYMNTIYNMVETDNTVDQKYATPLVSNIKVTDIRDDINRSITLCSMDEFGIRYVELPLQEKTSDNKFNEEISHFDLVFYPYKTYTQQNLGVSDSVLSEHFKQSFRLADSAAVLEDINSQLEPFKTLAHNITTPKNGELISIRNYLRLKALIATTTKVQKTESADIIKNIKLALVNNFNMRNIDFGEEIPFESILQVIEQADPRIKIVALEDPAVHTVFVTYDKEAPNKEQEYSLDALEGAVTVTSSYTPEYLKELKKLYNKLTLRNVLAGRVPLFDYNNAFIPDFGEAPLLTLEAVEGEPPVEDPNYEKIYITADDEIKKVIDSDGNTYFTDGTTTYKLVEQQNTYPSDSKEIDHLEGRFIIGDSASGEVAYQNITLQANEIIKFRAPNLMTTTTYPAYVNYNFVRAGDSINTEDGTLEAGQYAKSLSLESAMFANEANVSWNNLYKYVESVKGEIQNLSIQKGSTNGLGNVLSENDWSTIRLVKKIKEGEAASYFKSYDELHKDIDNEIKDLNNGTTSSEIKYIWYPLNSSTIKIWNDFIKKSDKDGIVNAEGTSSIYGSNTEKFPLAYLSNSAEYAAGRLISENGLKFILTSPIRFNRIASDPFAAHVIIDPGKDAIPATIKSNTEYRLCSSEYLYINYTTSEKAEDGSQGEGKVVNLVYGPGTIIRPNFDLNPSKYLMAYNLAAVTKEVTFNNPVEGGDAVVQMLTLGASEQIEIRELMKVTPGITDDLAKNQTVSVRYFYNFVWPEGKQEYELQNGEYFFISDKQGLSSAYYGSGSVIKLVGEFKLGIFTEDQRKVNIAAVLTDGLHLLSWKTQAVSRDNHFEIIEYQYQTLAEGNILVNATPISDNQGTPHEPWVAVDDVAYKSSAKEITPSTLPQRLLGDEYLWEMRTFLSLNMSPTIGQTLHSTSSNTTDTHAHDELHIYYTDGTESELKANSDQRLTIKSTQPVYSNMGLFDWAALKETLNTTSPLQLRCFDQQQIASISCADPLEYDEDTGIPSVSPQIYNLLAKTFGVTENGFTLSSVLDSEIINETWVKLAGKDLYDYEKKKPNPLTLDITLPADSFGIFSIYVTLPKSNLANDTISLTASQPEAIQLINSSSADSSIGLVPEGKNSNLSCIKIVKSCTLYLSLCNTGGSISKADAENISILWDAPRYVNNKNNSEGIYQSLLKYQAIGEEEPSKQILNDIGEVLAGTGYSFYYTSPIENALALELYEESEAKTMTDSSIFYDVNNINNHFVTSVIDIDYIDSGITIAKSSKY